MTMRGEDWLLLTWFMCQEAGETTSMHVCSIFIGTAAHCGCGCHHDILCMNLFTAVCATWPMRAQVKLFYFIIAT